MYSKALFGVVLSLASLISSHYTFPSLILNGSPTGDWVYVRITKNANTHLELGTPVTAVSSDDLRCYTAAGARSSTARVSAGAQIGFQANRDIYHPSVFNIYMAKAPGNVSDWDGSGKVWFRIHEVPPVTNGGSSISFPAMDTERVEFTLPSSLPGGQYLVRVENFSPYPIIGGAQFFISCAQIEVTGGGDGAPGPLVAIPGVYTGREPGILLNIYKPVPASYVMPGPALWRG